MIMKFEGHNKAQSYLKVYDDGVITFISYTTMIAKIDEDGWLTVVNWYGSNTTIRHIGWFAKWINKNINVCGENNLCWQDLKDMYDRGYRYNVITGEID